MDEKSGGLMNKLSQSDVRRMLGRDASKEIDPDILAKLRNGLEMWCELQISPRRGSIFDEDEDCEHISKVLPNLSLVIYAY